MAFFLVKAFTALFIVVDPLGCLPIFITLTSFRTRKERKSIALKAVLAAFLILLVFSIAGRSVFSFFGTTMGAFQVAGGILLFLIAMNMLRVERSGFSQTVREEVEESKEFEDVSIVPLAMPLLAGPSAIATVIVLVEEGSAKGAYPLVVAAIAGVFAATYFILRMSGIVFKLFGKTGLFLAMRLMGLILAAVSVQFIADGLVQLFPILKAA